MSVAARALVAVVVVVSGLALPHRVEAQAVDEQQHSGDVTIIARFATALQGIDSLVFNVEREIPAAYHLQVPLTLSPGIIAASRLSHTVIIRAGTTTTQLQIGTSSLDPDAATGDVTATIGDGEMHDVGDPSSASVRLHVGDPLVTVRLNAASYTLDEGVGSTTDEVTVIVRTAAGVPAPNRAIEVSVSTQSGTAVPVDDFGPVSEHVTIEGAGTRDWTAFDGYYRSEVAVPLTIVDDGLVEDDEMFPLLLARAPSTPATVAVGPADSSSPRCPGPDGTFRCTAPVTIVDNDFAHSVVIDQTGTLAVDEGAASSYTAVLDGEPSGDVTVTPEVQSVAGADISVSEALVFTPQNWNIPQTVAVAAAADDNAVHGSATIAHTVTGGDYGADGVAATSVTVAETDREGRTVVTLVRVPDDTVIPDNSTLWVGETVEDGSTFVEGERALYRLLFSAADGGRARYGVDVELSFEWDYATPEVPVTGQISSTTLSLPRVDVWDSAVRILDNDIVNPGGTVTVRITGCERNGCVIGEPSEITLNIADDDAPPPESPRPPSRPWDPC